MALNITTFSIMKLSMKDLYVTLSINVPPHKRHSAQRHSVLWHSAYRACMWRSAWMTICITYTQHNDIQHYETRHKGLVCDTQHEWHWITDAQHNDIHHYETQHKRIVCDTQHDDIQNYDTQHNNALHCSECCILFIVLLSVVMLNVVMLNVLNVIMLSVLAQWHSA